MFERYHLGLALTALALGLMILVVDRFMPVLSTRTVALAGALGALLGSWENPRSAPWVVLAVAAVAFPDNPKRAHPLGRFCLPLVVVTLVGIWAAVPDTEPPLAAALVLLPLAVAHSIAGKRPGPAATIAMVLAISGAAWVGSAGWGAALASLGAVGLIASLPLLAGFGRVVPMLGLGVLVGLQGVTGLVLPRVLMGRSVAVAVTSAVVVNLVLAAVVLVGGFAANGRVALKAPGHTGIP